MATYPDSQVRRGRAAEAQPDRTSMRILVIEDDRDAADYLVKALAEVGHVADAAADGEDGLAMALDGQYDVLVVDRMLPRRDGLSVIGALREKGVDTPVLILSALGQVDDRAKGVRAGAAVATRTRCRASQISSATVCPIWCGAGRRRYRGSRASCACSNIS